MKSERMPLWRWSHLLSDLTLVGLLMLWFSGVVLYGLDQAVTEWQETYAMQWRHPAQMVHASATWLMLWMSGRVIASHATHHIQRVTTHRRAIWGALGGSALLVLGLSGWLLMYGSADWHDFTADIHFWLGLCALPVWLFHMRQVR